jgi:hypothetical protein
VDEIMRDVQSSTEKVTVGSFRPLTRRVGRALSRTRTKNTRRGWDCVLSTSVD